jgi:hypothetical protein
MGLEISPRWRKWMLLSGARKGVPMRALRSLNRNGRKVVRWAQHFERLLPDVELLVIRTRLRSAA